MTLSVDGLTVAYGSSPVDPAVDDVSFAVGDGEVLALVGESGSGKSSTVQGVAGLLRPPGSVVAGSVAVDGVDLAAPGGPAPGRRSPVSMIFQEPRSSLDPMRRVGSQLSEVVRRHATVNRGEASRRSRSLLGDVGFDAPDRVMRSYPHELSGGMCQRVAIALALACSPRVLVADEPTASLDPTIAAQVLALLRRLASETGMALVLVTHNLRVIPTVADRVAVMYAGRIVEECGATDLLTAPAMPYTVSLVAALPDHHQPRTQLSTIRSGSVPQHGCRFAPRCDRRVEACEAEEPELGAVSTDRTVRCLAPVPMSESIDRPLMSVVTVE